MMRAFLALSLIILAPSCLVQSKKNTALLDTSCQTDVALDSFFDSFIDRQSAPSYEPVLVTSGQALEEYEARLIDIPNYLPGKLIKGSVVEDVHNNQYIQLQYQVPTDHQEIKKFYSKEMERFGWCNYATMLGVESILIFEKPGKVCSILLRSLAASSHKNSVSTTVLVTVGARHTS